MTKKLVASLALLAALPLTALASSPAQAATYGMTTTSAVNLRTGPGTGYAVAGSVPAGGTVDIRCYVIGQTLTDAKGYNNSIWNRTASGAYVWDGLVNTGSNNAVVPKCDAGTGGATAQANAFWNFYNTYNGKAVDVDGAWGAQCWDLAAKWAQYNGYPAIATGNGAAYGIYTNYASNGNATYYDRIPNTPSAVPRVGDIIVWGTGIGSFGHVAIVQSATVNSFTGFEQNWNGAMYARSVTHSSYANVLGWLRPKKFAG